MVADLVLADPPYDFDDWAGLLGVIEAPFVVAEASQPLDRVEGLDDLPWEVVRTKRYGRTWVTFLERIDPDGG